MGEDEVGWPVLLLALAVAALGLLVDLVAVGLLADVVGPRDAGWCLALVGFPLGVVGGIAGILVLRSEQ